MNVASLSERATRCHPDRRPSPLAHDLPSDGVDDETWLFHLTNGDYERWIRDAIKDASLAEQVHNVAQESELSPEESRQRIRSLIEDEYTVPA